jgi:uncharacterized tellurite resistance protein B-like protein
MLDRLLKSLFAPAPQPLADADARLALTALLVRIARSDNDYARVEIARIEEIVAARFGLTGSEATDLRQHAEQLEAAAPDTVRFTQAIKEAVDIDARIAVVEAAWRVALADGSRAEEEAALMRLVANLLGVNDRDSNLARQRAAKA